MSVRLALVPIAGVPGLTGTGEAVAVAVALVGGGRGDTKYLGISRVFVVCLSKNGFSGTGRYLWSFSAHRIQ